jgi:DNA-binding CsgD family transcriptional regulator
MAAELHRAEAPDREALPDGDAFPYGAEAVIDPSKANVVDATSGARAADALQALREGAIRVDRARGRLRRDNPKEALEMWWALTSERWSLVDWFDSDDRRYLLAVPNAPEVKDPRNLTPREKQVVAHAVMGESHKIIAYRLGVSRPRVTNALRSAMRKLGASTQAELVARWRPLVAPPVASRDGR